MRSMLFPTAVAFTALISVPAFAQSSTSDPSSLNHSQLKQLIREAHTPEQYQTLATYFRAQEKLYNDKAAVEKQEWDRRAAITTGPEMKPPTGADSARNLYQYYVEKSQEMATLASNYEQRLR
jgi:hypothetical protein